MNRGQRLEREWIAGARNRASARTRGRRGGIAPLNRYRLASLRRKPLCLARLRRLASLFRTRRLLRRALSAVRCRVRRRRDASRPGDLGGAGAGDLGGAGEGEERPAASRRHGLRGGCLARVGRSWVGRAAYRVFWLVLRMLSKLLFRLRVEGVENLPNGPFILSPVHRSFIDTPIAGIITRRRLRFMGKESLWDRRALGAFLSFFGGFPVERGTADRSALRMAVEVLENGEPLVMFPEGTRRSAPVMRRCDMTDGPAFVAERADVPIVPVGLGGTARALPMGARIPRPVRIVAVVGGPVYPESGQQGGRLSRKQVCQLTDKLFEELDDLYAQAQVLAGGGRLSDAADAARFRLPAGRLVKRLRTWSASIARSFKRGR